MPKGNKNLIQSLRSAHDPHFKLEGRVEELEKKLPIQIADLHKTLSKSFGMQRKTLVRVLALEKKIEEFKAAKEKVEEVIEDIKEEEISEEEIPEGLDDVLDDIRGEKGTATKKKPKKKPRKKPTARKIPKKKLVAKKKKISAAALKKGTALDSDFKSRVYGIDEEGEYLTAEERKIRFRKSKISADDIRGAKPADPPSELPAGKDDKETEGLKGIRDVLDDILKVLRLDFKGDRKEARDAQKEAARKKRGEKEDKLEGGGKAAGGIKKALGAMVKPFSSIWDGIVNFIKNVFIGVVFNKLLKWFTNPKNQDKVKSIGKFFKDWWPALSAAALLFLTPLGGLVKGVVGLLTAIIPKLVVAIAANPWAAAAVLGGVAIWGVSKMAGGKKKNNETGGKAQMSGGGVVPHVVDAPTSAQNFIQKYNQGGLVQHLKTGGSPQEGDISEGYRMGQMLPEQFYYSKETLKSSFKEKGGKILEDKTELTELSGAIGMPDLIEHQQQLVNSIRKVKGYEDINFMDVVQYPSGQGRLVGMPEETLFPILNSSDAWKASDAKRNAAAAETALALNTGGKVPGSGNKDTVPAMLTPGEFVMSKGAVNRYGTDTLENMNAAAGSGSSSKKKDTVPAMLTPGEFVVSAPAVQQYGVNTMESMNLKGGGNNRPEYKEPSVSVNNGGLISNYRNMKTNHYYTGGLVQYLQGGGEVNKPQGMMRWLAGAADVATGGVFDFDKRGSMVDGAKRLTEKVAPGTPVTQGENKTITLPTIPKEDQSRTRSNSDIPQFRISIQSTQRSMILSSLGIADLVGGR